MSISYDTGQAACCSLASVLDPDRAAVIAAMFKALGDPVRLRLASMIAATDEICVCDLAPAFELSGPTISHHLKVLREAGLVECERRGTWVHYWIRPAALAELGALLRLEPQPESAPRTATGTGRRRAVS